MGRGRWWVAALAAAALIGAVLFAVLPYTVPIHIDSTSQVECDAALAQVFGSPKFGIGSTTQNPIGTSWTATKNFKPPCLSVAHYRLGIAGGLLLLAIVLGLLVAFDVRRGRRSSADNAVEPLYSHG